MNLRGKEKTKWALRCVKYFREVVNKQTLRRGADNLAANYLCLQESQVSFYSLVCYLTVDIIKIELLRYFHSSVDVL